MDFKKWAKLQETTFSGLYDSTVTAFPQTTKRQHVTQPIEIVNINWTPYLGMKTLFIRATARNENREYNPIILFKGVKYHDKRNARNLTKLTVEGKDHFLEKLLLERDDVLVRCNCPDFRWRFAWYNHLDRILYGRLPSKYEAKGTGVLANPFELKGVCKHIIKLAEVLQNFPMIG